MISRRAVLAVAALSAGCSQRRAALSPPRNTLPAVRVSKDRVIRNIGGLRPYRPSGFVVKAEALGSKRLVHNYGHGGAGITLSWGTAQLAADLVKDLPPSACAVIGCGVIGLSTARLLQRRGYQPVIYAKALPPETTSNIAGGLWSPVTLFDRSRALPEFRQQFAMASTAAHQAFQLLVGDHYAVRWLSMYSLSDHAFPPPGPAAVEPHDYAEGTSPFRVPHARRSQVMLIEPSIYLPALMRDFLLQGGRIVVREFASASDLAALDEPVIFNCTGLGAKALFHDEELTPVKGQLVFLAPQPEINYCTIGPGDIYMFPRRDGILLGGSHEQGNWDAAPDPAVTERILSENAALFSRLS